jgi:hypothetical protein
MRGWAIVCVWIEEFMIRHVGKFEQLPGFDEQACCERIVGGMNRRIALGRSVNRIPGICYYITLPYPVVLEAPVVFADALDDTDHL